MKILHVEYLESVLILDGATTLCPYLIGNSWLMDGISIYGLFAIIKQQFFTKLS